MIASSMQQLESRVMLSKLSLDDQMRNRGKKILIQYLSEVDIIPEINDKVYAMGKVIASSLGVHIKVSEKGGKRKARREGRNRMELKLKEEIKGLRQTVSRTSSELYRRRQQ